MKYKAASHDAANMFGHAILSTHREPKGLSPSLKAYVIFRIQDGKSSLIQQCDCDVCKPEVSQFAWLHQPLRTKLLPMGLSI